jgi:hypothetical protein
MKKSDKIHLLTHKTLGGAIALAAPAVTTDIADKTVSAGATVSLFAQANGNPTPWVQWQKSINAGVDFTDIAGADKNTYSFVALIGYDGYQYQAIFTNSEGSDTAGPMTLTVTT